MSKVTFFILVIDRSGSLQARIEETIIVANAQIDLIRKSALRSPLEEIYCSVYTFNQNVLETAHLTKPADLKDISIAELVPDGTSALYDALGTAIGDMQLILQNLESYRKAKVMVIIFSDGYDNASKVFTSEAISTMISQLEKTRRWSFSFIGTTFDAVEQAQKLHIKAKNAMYIGSSLSLRLVQNKAKKGLAIDAQASNETSSNG